MRRATVAATVALVLAGVATPAKASFHLMMIREVFAGTAADPDAQYIMLQMWSGSQNFVSGQSVEVSDENGSVVGTFTFGSNVLNGVNQDTILVATADAQTRFGVSADLAMTPVIPKAGGKVCFAGITDCASWGSYGGGDAGTPFNASEGLIDSSAMKRTIARGNPSVLDQPDDTNNSAADFFFAAPAPRNNARVNGSCGCGSAGFDATVYPALENDGTVTVTVTRTNTSGSDTIGYSTVDGTAQAGSDYVAATGTLSFDPGETTESIAVTLIDDGMPEPTETFGVRIRSPGTTMLSRPNVVVELSDPPTPPSAPQNLIATGQSGQIRLDWQAPASSGGSPVTSYRVFGGSSSGSLAVIATVSGTTLTDTESGLGSGVTRFYAVSAVNASGEGPQSNEASATTSILPGPPTSFTLTPGASSITLDWGPPVSDGGSPVTSYRVYGGSASGSLAVIATVPASTLAYTESGLASGVTRFYKVSALNANGEGEPAPVRSATTQSVPSAPASLSATAGPGAGQIRLLWTPPASTGGLPLTGYRIYVGEAPGGSTTPLAQVAPSPLQFTHAGLPSAATRYYRIAAINSAGEGPPSVERSATTFDVPSPPQNLTASPGGGVGQIRLNWALPASNGGAPVSGFRIYRSDAGGPETFIAQVGLTTVFTDSGRTVLQNYAYRVAALNIAGQGGLSNSACNKPFPWVAALGCIG